MIRLKFCNSYSHSKLKYNFFHDKYGSSLRAIGHWRQERQVDSLNERLADVDQSVYTVDKGVSDMDDGGRCMERFTSQ